MPWTDSPLVDDTGNLLFLTVLAKQPYPQQTPTQASPPPQAPSPPTPAPPQSQPPSEPQPPSELEQPSAPRRKVRFEGKIYSFPSDWQNPSIERWFAKNKLADRRKFMPEQTSTGRSKWIDSPAHEQLRRNTELGPRGQQEYAEMFQVNPEHVTPDLLAEAIKQRKEAAAKAQLPQVNLRRGTFAQVNKRELQDFIEDTSAMERDLTRLWANETTLEYKQRLALMQGRDPTKEQATLSAKSRDEAVLISREAAPFRQFAKQVFKDQKVVNPDDTVRDVTNADRIQAAIGVVKLQDIESANKPLQVAAATGRILRDNPATRDTWMLVTGWMAKRAADKIAAGDTSPENYLTVASYLHEQEKLAEETQNWTWYRNIAEGIYTTLGYASAFAGSGGVTQSIEQILAKTPRKMIGKAVDVVLTESARLAISPQMQEMALQRAVGRAAPKLTDTGLAPGDPFVIALGKSLPEQVIGQLTERMGGLLPFKSAVAKAMGRNPNTIRSVAQWDGVLGEWFEERFGDVGQGLWSTFIGEGADFGTTGKVLSGDPQKTLEGLKDLGVEAAVIGAISAPGMYGDVRYGQRRAQELERVKGERAARQEFRELIPPEVRKLARMQSRLDTLQQIRAKGFVAVADGIPGENRQERMDNLNQEINQLEQEIKDAEAVRSDQEVPSEAGQVGEGGQADRGGDVYRPEERQGGTVGGGQEPEAQVGPTPTPSESLAGEFDRQLLQAMTPQEVEQEWRRLIPGAPKIAPGKSQMIKEILAVLAAPRTEPAAQPAAGETTSPVAPAAPATQPAAAPTPVEESIDRALEEEFGQKPPAAPAPPAPPTPGEPAAPAPPAPEAAAPTPARQPPAGELPPHLTEMLQERGVDPSQVKVLSSAEEEEHYRRLYGIPNVVALPGQSPFGRRGGRLYVNDDTGLPVAYAPPNYESKVPSGTAMESLYTPVPSPKPDSYESLPPSLKRIFDKPTELKDSGGNPPQTGKPFRASLFTGSGRTEPGSIYAEGAEGPAFGSGRYTALSEDVARGYGPNVSQVDVVLKNPLVLDSDEELSKLGGGFIGYENRERNAILRKARETVESQDHDGVIILLPEGDFGPISGKPNKRLREVFAHSQVIEFSPATPPAAPPKKIGVREEAAAPPPEPIPPKSLGVKETAAPESAPPAPPAPPAVLEEPTEEDIAETVRKPAEPLTPEVEEALKKALATPLPEQEPDETDIINALRAFRDKPKSVDAQELSWLVSRGLVEKTRGRKPKITDQGRALLRETERQEREAADRAAAEEEKRYRERQQEKLAQEKAAAQEKAKAEEKEKEKEKAPAKVKATLSLYGGRKEAERIVTQLPQMQLEGRVAEEGMSGPPGSYWIHVEGTRENIEKLLAILNQRNLLVEREPFIEEKAATGITAPAEPAPKKIGARTPAAPKLQPHVVIAEVRDNNGNLLGYETEPHDGSLDGMRLANDDLRGRLDSQYPNWSNVNTRTGATDENGNPQFVISPNGININPVGTSAANYTLFGQQAPKQQPKVLPASTEPTVQKKIGARREEAPAPSVPPAPPTKVGRRGQFAIPGLEQEAAAAEAREAEAARWKPYVDELVGKDIGVTEEAAQELMRDFPKKVREAFLDNLNETSVAIAGLLTRDLEIAGKGRAQEANRDTATEIIEPAVNDVMKEVAPTLQEAEGWKVGQDVETSYPKIFGKIEGFAVKDGVLQANVKPSDGPEKTYDLTDLREYEPEPQEEEVTEEEEEEKYQEILKQAREEVAKEKAKPKEQDWVVSRTDVENAYEEWSGGKGKRDDWSYVAGRAVKVLDQPDYIEGDVVGKTFLAPLRRSRDNSQLLWIGGKLYLFAGYEVTAMEQPLSDVDMETTVTTRELGKQDVVRHVVIWKDEKGQERGQAFSSLGQAKERAKELGRSASVRTEVGQIEDREVTPGDAPTVISYKDGRFVLAENITPQQASVALEEIREKYRYRAEPEVEALKDQLSGEAIKSQREAEPQAIKDKRELYRKALSEQMNAEAERGRRQSDFNRTIDRRAIEIARERGVPEGRRRGSLSEAKQYKPGIEQARKDAHKDPVVVEAKRQLDHATKVYETAARHAREFQADLNKATGGERIPEGSVFVSKGKGPSFAIRVGEYDEKTGTYEYEHGTLVESSGQFYGQSYGGAGERGITANAIRENYGTVAESRQMRAVALQALQAIDKAKEARAAAEAKKRQSEEAKRIREAFRTEYPKVTAAQVMPKGEMLYAKYGDKPVITNGRFAIVQEAAPKSMQKRMNLEGIHGGRYSAEKPLDIGDAVPMKGSPNEELRLVGYELGTEKLDNALLTDGKSVWRVDAKVYALLSAEGITFHAPETVGKMEIVGLAKNGERVGGVAPIVIGDETTLSLKTLQETLGKAGVQVEAATTEAIDKLKPGDTEYRGFRIERVTKATQVGYRLGRGTRSPHRQVSGYDLTYPDSDAKKFVATLKEAQEYIDQYFGSTSTEAIDKALDEVPVFTRQQAIEEARQFVRQQLESGNLEPNVVDEQMADLDRLERDLKGKASHADILDRGESLVREYKIPWDSKQASALEERLWSQLPEETEKKSEQTAQELKDAAEELKKSFQTPLGITPDPKREAEALDRQIKAAARFIKAAVNHGIVKFQEFVSYARKQGYDGSVDLLAKMWNRLRIREGYTHLEEATVPAAARAPAPVPASSREQPRGEQTLPLSPAEAKIVDAFQSTKKIGTWRLISAVRQASDMSRPEFEATLRKLWEKQVFTFEVIHSGFKLGLTPEQMDGWQVGSEKLGWMVEGAKFEQAGAKSQAERALKEAYDELKKSFQTPLGITPDAKRDAEALDRQIKAAVKLAKAAIDYGVTKFQEYVNYSYAHGYDGSVDLLAQLWNRLRLREGFRHLDEATEATGVTEPTEATAPTAAAPVAAPVTPVAVETTAEQAMLPGPEDLTSIKKAIVNALREMVGLPEMEGSTPQTVEQWAEEARATLAADPKAAIRLVNELATNPRPISQSDAMLLQFRYRQLANELKPAVEEYFDAVQAKDPVAIATARTAVQNARNAMTSFEEIIHPSKETWGRTGVALQQLLRQDFSLAAVLRRGRESNHGEPLSPEQTAELTALAKQLEALQKQFDEQRRKMEELERELASKKQHEEALKHASETNVRKKSERRQAAEKRVADAWEKFKKAVTGRVGAGIPVDLLPPAIEVAKAYVELGVVRFGEFMAHVRQKIGDEADEAMFRKAWDTAAKDVVVTPLDRTDLAALSVEARRIQRLLVESGMKNREEVINAVHAIMSKELPDFTRRQTMDALSRYGQFSLPSQGEIEKLIRDMNSEILKLSQIDQMEKAIRRAEELRNQGMTDEEIGNVLVKENLLVAATGFVRDKPTPDVRQLTKEYNELKKRIPASSEGRAGLLQTAVASIERALTNRIQDLTWEITHGERMVKEKRERPSNERIKELEAERDRLLAIHREMFPPVTKPITDEQRLANAIKAAERAIAVIEKQLASGDFDRPQPRAPVSSAELDAVRARLAALRAQREVAKTLALSKWEEEGGALAPDKSAERARKIYEASLRKRIADYQQILAAGDFSPKPKIGARTLSNSELALKRKMEDVRHEVLRKYAEYHLAHLRGMAWTADKITEAAHLSRALMTSFDMSALLRQGGLVALGHPVLAQRALTETVASIARTFDKSKAFNADDFKWSELEQFLTGIDSRQAEFNVMHTLTQGPEGEFRLRAGLNLPSTDEAITRQEEVFQGRWGKMVPGVALSSRLYTIILNKMRADLFDSMVHNLGHNGKVTLDEAKIIADFVNVATGRSDFGKFNNKAALLNTVFFAPRYVASRFQYLAMPFYLPFKGGLKANWQVKQAIYKEYGRTATGIATVLGAIALAAQLFWDDDDEDKPTIETDPRSADFLKVKIGETRLDFLAGLSQTIVLSTRMALGQTKSPVSGKVRTLGEGYKADTRLDVLWNFARTKFAPVPGTIATVMNDWTNVVGQKETVGSLAGSIITPLSLRDVSTTMREQGLLGGTAMSLLSVLGVGMTTYGPKTDYVTGTSEERAEQVKADLKNMQWDDSEYPAYSEFLTNDELKTFSNRWREKRGLVIFNATYTGQNEDELAIREKNSQYLQEMRASGVSLDEAQQLLLDYYRLKFKSEKRANDPTLLDKKYSDRRKALAEFYGQ